MVDFGKVGEDFFNSVSEQLPSALVNTGSQYITAKYAQPQPGLANSGGSTAASQLRTPYQAQLPPNTGWAGIAPNQKPPPEGMGRSVLIVGAVLGVGVLILLGGMWIFKR